MKLADGWLKCDGSPAGSLLGGQLVDIELPGATIRGIRANAVTWKNVISYRVATPIEPAAEDDTPVTLNEARKAMMLICARMDMSAQPTQHDAQRVKDFLDQQVPGEILNNENAGALFAQMLDNANAEITRLRALVRPAERYVVRCG